ncbi:hypothetical protein [Streptomyces xanthophaeus]
MIELVAMLTLVAVATLVYVVTGPAGFSSIISAGGGLFATWRAFRGPGRVSGTPRQDVPEGDRQD